MASEPSITLLLDTHDREGFDCGESSLDEFLRRYALQHMRKNVSRTWVLAEDAEILAYITLCLGEILRTDIPPGTQRRLPHHAIPVLRIARLATATQHQGKGHATRLLVDALQKAVIISSVAGLHAIEVHALNNTAEAFYSSFGFRSLVDSNHHLYLPLATAAEAFERR
jgi:GNAT superfamily N-acetyltransferase